MTKLIVFPGIVIGLLCGIGLGQADGKTEVKGEEILTASVESVSGSAEVREDSDKSWRAIKAGDVYKEGAEIRTGYRAKVELAFGDNSQITIKRVSRFRVDKFRRSGRRVITRSHLSYGKVRAGVEKGSGLSDYTINTSLGILGVNGTQEIDLYVDPGSGIANVSLSHEGNIGWNTGKGSEVNVDPGGSTDEEGTPQGASKKKENTIGLRDYFGSTKSEKNLAVRLHNQGQMGVRRAQSGSIHHQRRLVYTTN